MGLSKKISITTLAITCCVCLGLIAWYVFVLVFAPAKIVSQTFEVGKQRVIDKNGNVNAKNFIEVNLYNNVFEIKFNYMLDEKQESFYSQGLQYVLKDTAKDFKFSGSYQTTLDKNYGSYYRTNSSWPIYDYTRNNNIVLTDIRFDNLDKFNYMSGNDYETPLFSSNPIDLDTMFKIQLGDELYGMKFKGADSIGEEDFKINTEKGLVDTKAYLGWANHYYDVNNYFKASDVDLFAEIVYGAVCGVASGTNTSLVFEFGDLFNYYQYDEEKKQYVENKVTTDVYAKITADVKNYYAVSVTKYDEDMDSSSDSMFNMFKGKANYNTEENIDDYFLGRTLAFATNKDFEFIETNDSMVFDFKLRDSFIEYYSNFTKLELFVQIDLDSLKELGITFNGFIEGTFDEFKNIYKIVTIETIDGVLVEKGVAYA